MTYEKDASKLTLTKNYVSLSNGNIKKEPFANYITPQKHSYSEPIVPGKSPYYPCKTKTVTSTKSFKEREWQAPIIGKGSNSFFPPTELGTPCKVTERTTGSNMQTPLIPKTISNCLTQEFEAKPEKSCLKNTDMYPYDTIHPVINQNLSARSAHDSNKKRQSFSMDPSEVKKVVRFSHENQNGYSRATKRVDLEPPVMNNYFPKVPPTSCSFDQVEYELYDLKPKEQETAWPSYLLPFKKESHNPFPLHELREKDTTIRVDQNTHEIGKRSIQRTNGRVDVRTEQPSLKKEQHLWPDNVNHSKTGVGSGTVPGVKTVDTRGKCARITDHELKPVSYMPSYSFPNEHIRSVTRRNQSNRSDRLPNRDITLRATQALDNSITHNNKKRSGYITPYPYLQTVSIDKSHVGKLNTRV